MDSARDAVDDLEVEFWEDVFCVGPASSISELKVISKWYLKQPYQSRLKLLRYL